MTNTQLGFQLCAAKHPAPVTWRLPTHHFCCCFCASLGPLHNLPDWLSFMLMPHSGWCMLASSGPRFAKEYALSQHLSELTVWHIRRFISRFLLIIFVFVWGHTGIFRGYSWLCSQESFLVMLGGSHVVPEIDPISATFEASNISPVPSFWCQIFALCNLISCILTCCIKY